MIAHIGIFNKLSFECNLSFPDSAFGQLTRWHPFWLWLQYCVRATIPPRSSLHKTGLSKKDEFLRRMAIGPLGLARTQEPPCVPLKHEETNPTLNPTSQLPRLLCSWSRVKLFQRSHQMSSLIHIPGMPSNAMSIYVYSILYISQIYQRHIVRNVFHLPQSRLEQPEHSSNLLEHTIHASPVLASRQLRRIGLVKEEASPSSSSLILTFIWVSCLSPGKFTPCWWPSKHRNKW